MSVAPHPHMQRLGQYLIERGLITEEQLNEALQCQAVFGGRLGTNLVELGYLSLEDLARLLGVRAGLPVAPVEWLESPQPEALERLSPQTCEQYRVLPLRLESGALHVAMMDPTSQSQMETLKAEAEIAVRPYVVPELRMYVWLERHLGVKRQIRFARLGRQYSRGPGAGTLVGEPITADPRADRLRALGMNPLGVGEELTSEDDQMAMATGGEPVEILVEEALPELSPMDLQPIETGGEPALAPPRSPAEVTELEKALATSANRDAVAASALRLARGHVRAAALFVVNKGMLQGFRGAGDVLDRQDIGGILLPASADSFLRAAAQRGEAWRGRGISGDINTRLLKALGRQPAPSEVAVFPVKIRGRVVNVLYVDNGPDALGNSAYAALAALADNIGGAYEHVILSRKKDSEKPTPASSS